jgi:hypothetical protein
MQRSVRRRLWAMGGVLALGWLAVGSTAGLALAGQTLSGPEITKLVSGNTVQGSMQDSGAYSEYYDEDGTIKGKDYTGKWTVESDTMCFVYKAADPKMCWSVAVNNGEVSWVDAAGKVDGTGAVVKGNPNNY